MPKKQKPSKRKTSSDRLQSRYLDLYKSFEVKLHEAKLTSQSVAGILETPRRVYATVLFTRLIVFSHSMLLLAPRELSKDEHYDFASIASIARGILECYVFMYYFSVEEISEDDWNARLYLAQLHDCVSRIELFETLQKINSKPNPDIIEFLKQADEIRIKLKGTAYFSQLSNKSQNDYLKGKKVMFFSQDQIVEKIGWSVADYRLHYQLFSRYLHALPFSFYRSVWSGDAHTTGGKNEKDIGYTAMTFECIQGIIENAEKDIVHIFSKNS